MASSVVYALCLVLCVCSLQSAVLAKKEKISFTIYVNEIRGGPDVTILAAAGTGQGNFSALGWGSFLTSENILKEGPSPDSATLGISTGFGVLTTKGGFVDGGTQVINKIWFSQSSKYAGASITVLGTLAFPPAGPWELTAIAGTGVFRGYYGFVVANPYLPTSVAPLFVYKFEFHLYKLF